MRKEVKLNLLFIGILIVLMAPGIVIVMRKKLSGSSKPSYLPHDVPMSVAYNQPPPVPPRLPRVEPSEARQWVTQLLQERVGPNALLSRSEGGAAPVMGDAFVTQLLTVAPRESGWTVCVMLWTERQDVSERNPTLTLISSTGRPIVEHVSVERLDVPKLVRHSLQKVGYIRPPEKVWLLTGQAGPTNATPASLTVRFAGQDAIENVPLTISTPPTTSRTVTETTAQ